MKLLFRNQGRRALTLMEILLVIAVVAILAALLSPLRGDPKGRATGKLAQVEIQSLISAVHAYETNYGRLPLADMDTNDDITFGIDPTLTPGFQRVSGTRWVSNNSDVIIILLDIDQGVNAGHRLNPQKRVFLDPKMAKNVGELGVSINDFQYRDPWGNPYVISLNASQDNWTRDAVYASPLVSSKLLSTHLQDHDGAWEGAGQVMVWSRGPDGRADPNSAGDAGVNKDNVLSWE